MKRSLIIGALIIATSISTLVVVFQQRSSSLRCALDGIRIDPLYQVTVIGRDEVSRSFSCILSAEIWLKENGEEISSIWVTDEESGEKIRAGLAYYVESDVITTPHTGNRIHVFAQEKAARLHASTFNGKWVKNPVRVPNKKPTQLVQYSAGSPNRAHMISNPSYKPMNLASKPFVFKKQDLTCLFHIYIIRLSAGFLLPLEKPPKIIV